MEFHAPVAVTLQAAASGSTTNTAEIRFSNMPALTGATQVVGVELWDQFTTPVRIWYGPLATPKNTNLGDDFVIAAGDLDITLA